MAWILNVIKQYQTVLGQIRTEFRADADIYMTTNRNMLRNIMIMLTVALSGGVAVASPHAGAGPAVESHAHILDTARGFLEQQLAGRPGNSEIRIGALDRRLRLARCDGALEGYLPPGGRLAGNTSVGVRCNGAQSWKLYVPARIALLEEVVVTRGFLPRGTQIGPEHIEIAERDVTASAHGYLSGLDEVIGMVLKQPLQGGLVLTPAMIDRPRLIRRGEEVVIVSRTGNFEVRMAGNALADGAEGDRIRVRNNKSKRIIEGRVTAHGAVLVQM